MNDEDSNMAANGMIHEAFRAFQSVESWMTGPSVLYRPRLSIDGNKWCALYGDNSQDGVAGFGVSPAEAMADFDKNWFAKLD